MQNLSGLLEKARLEEKGEDEGEARLPCLMNFVANIVLKCVSVCLFVV